MNCNDFRELIALYVEGDLNPADTIQLEQHLETCADCREFAEEIRESQSSLKKLQDSTDSQLAMDAVRQRVLNQIRIDREPRRLFGWKWQTVALAALMAAAALAGAVTFVRLIPRHAPDVPTVKMQKAAPAETQSAPSAAQQPATQTTTAKTTEPEQNQIKPSDVTPPPVAVAAGSIFGKVVDDKGVPLPGVSVTLRSKLIPVMTVSADAHGEYRFSNLPTGNYSLEWKLEGFTTIHYSSLNVIGSERKLLAKMHVTLSEEITLIGETPVVDTKKTGAHGTFNKEYLEEVPSARDPWVVVDQTQGADSDRYNVAGPQSGQQAGFAARGGSDDKATWNYDGANATDPGAKGATPTYFDYDPAETSVVAAEEAQLPAPPPPPPPPATTVSEMSANQAGGPHGTQGGQGGAYGRGVVGGTPGDVIVMKQKSQLLIVEQGKKSEAASMPDDRRQTQGTLVARDEQGKTIGEFPLKHTDVKADISGYLASTRVEQTYTNPYREAIEAVYVFPLPSMGAVNDFVMEIGDRKIIGIVRPREEAERIYREARERGQTASLLTQERPNIFTQNVANIEPGGKVVIRITYFEKLVYEKGHYEYVFPMVVGPRYIPGSAQPVPQGKESGGGWSAPTNQVPDADKITPPVLAPGQRSGHDISLRVNLKAGLPVSDASCPTHKVEIREDGASGRKIQLIEANAIPNRDFVLRWSVAGDETQFGVLSHRDKNGGFFTLMAQPPLNPSDEQVMPREITFILDVSGSMNGIPVQISKDIVRRSLDRMRPDDIFNIFYFASGNGQLWQSPQPNTPANVTSAKQFLETFQGSGGTEMLAGVHRALSAIHDSRYLQMYCFLTDGYVGNEPEILNLIQTERGDARFFAFGIGSSVNRYLIDGIGKLGGGVSRVVIPRDPNQAQKAADDFFENIDSPVLVDIDIDWNGLPVREIYPKKLPDLFAGQTINVIGRYARAAKGTAYVNARLGNRKLRIPIAVNFPDEEQNNAALAPVWARNKIEELSNLMLSADSNQQQDLVAQITDLAVKFRLVSQYTAFVAVDESRIVGNGKPLRILQPVELPEGVRYEGIFGASPIGRPMSVRSWGITLLQTSDGRIGVCDVQANSVAAQSGLKRGAILKAVNRTVVHDLNHLEGLLLQSSGNVTLEIDGAGEVVMPMP